MRPSTRPCRSRCCHDPRGCCSFHRADLQFCCFGAGYLRRMILPLFLYLVTANSISPLHQFRHLSQCRVSALCRQLIRQLQRQQSQCLAAQSRKWLLHHLVNNDEHARRDEGREPSQSSFYDRLEFGRLQNRQAGFSTRATSSAGSKFLMALLRVQHTMVALALNLRSCRRHQRPALRSLLDRSAMRGRDHVIDVPIADTSHASQRQWPARER